MPRTKPPEERRNDLLDAGESLLVEKGIAATTLDDVTRRAKVAKGTFYLYFRSKDDLVLALQQRFARRMADRITAAVAEADTWADKLDACVRACFEDYRAQYDLHDVLFHHVSEADRHHHDQDHDHDDHDLEAARSGLVGVFRDLLVAGIEAGAFQVDHPHLTAVLLYSAMHGAYDASCHGPQRPDERELVAVAQQLFRRAVALAPETAGR
jgi:TetR/AcrR family transcriptional repressor of nem operon